jgi:hypothetical protein
MYLQPCSCTRSPTSRQKGIRSSRSIAAYPGTMKPRRSTPHQAETIAPTPPRANFSSQLIRACVPLPS